MDLCPRQCLLFALLGKTLTGRVIVAGINDDVLAGAIIRRGVAIGVASILNDSLTALNWLDALARDRCCSISRSNPS